MSGSGPGRRRRRPASRDWRQGGRSGSGQRRRVLQSAPAGEQEPAPEPEQHSAGCLRVAAQRALPCRLGLARRAQQLWCLAVRRGCCAMDRAGTSSCRSAVQPPTWTRTLSVEFNVELELELDLKRELNLTLKLGLGLGCPTSVRAAEGSSAVVEQPGGAARRRGPPVSSCTCSRPPVDWAQKAPFLDPPACYGRRPGLPQCSAAETARADAGAPARCMTSSLSDDACRACRACRPHWLLALHMQHANAACNSACLPPHHYNVPSAHAIALHPQRPRQQTCCCPASDSPATGLACLPGLANGQVAPPPHPRPRRAPHGKKHAAPGAGARKALCF